MMKLGSLPSLRELKIALVCMATGRIDDGVQELGYNSTDKLRRVANMSREMSTKRCFFCEAERPKLKKVKGKVKTPAWEEYKLCACLAPLVKGYQEHMAWRESVMALAGKVQSGELPGNTPVYSDNCANEGCGKPFTIRAGVIASTVEQYGGHRQMRFCRKCADQNRKARQQQTAAVPAPVLSKESNGAKPTKRSQKAPRVLQASIGERIGSKEAEA